ncbi:MAG: hypothetical protein U1D30_09475 [Planctomycetota bacterium]
MRRFMVLAALGVFLGSLATDASAQTRTRVSAQDQRLFPANITTGGATPIPGSSFMKSNVVPGTARFQNNVIPGSKKISPNQSLVGVGSRGMTNQTTKYRAPTDGLQRGERSGKIEIPYQLQRNRQKSMMSRYGKRR